jgi:Tfp pilus assembly protein PilZ
VTRPDLRSVPRYFLSPSLPAVADDKLVRLVDLSVKGARLETDERFEPGREIILVVITDRGNLKVKAKVLWCDIDTLRLEEGSDSYLAGVAFGQAISNIDVLLDELCSRELAIRIEDSRNFDRYSITVPLTASFDEIAPISLVDVSIRGAKFASNESLEAGREGHLLFQVDDESGPISVPGSVVWSAPAITGGYYTGILISGHDDVLRGAIHRLCLRGEARIDLDTLRRKFDKLRTDRRQQVAG